MHKYLVQTHRSDHFNADILVTVLEVLQLVESDYGTIVVLKHDSGDGWNISPYFLDEVLKDGYKFSDNEKYKKYLTWEKG